MSKNQNLSEMIVKVAGDFLKNAKSQPDMQARVDIVKTAWNMSLLSKLDRQLKLKRLIKKQKNNAPSKEALNMFEAEIKRIILEKIKHYPDVSDEILKTEVIEKEAIKKQVLKVNEQAESKAEVEYDIKAFFKDAAAEQAHSQFSLTSFSN